MQITQLETYFLRCPLDIRRFERQGLAIVGHIQIARADRLLEANAAAQGTSLARRHYHGRDLLSQPFCFKSS